MSRDATPQSVAAKTSHRVWAQGYLVGVAVGFIVGLAVAVNW